MNEIPPDIYERVRELALAIVNASEAEDDALGASLCETFREYYEEQTKLGRAHPFLTEAMADYTKEPDEAIRLYQLAIEQARAISNEPIHTKMICLARELIEVGKIEPAEAYLVDGRSEAVRCGDEYWIKEADGLLRELKQ